MNRDVCEHFNPVDLPCDKCEEKRKSEALFLADELTIPLGTVIGSEVHRRAAAELRRLHAERKPLTKEEIFLLADQHTEKLQGGGELWHFDLFARAIEKAHGIGGNDE